MFGSVKVEGDEGGVVLWPERFFFVLCCDVVHACACLAWGMVYVCLFVFVCWKQYVVVLEGVGLLLFYFFLKRGEGGIYYLFCLFFNIFALLCFCFVCSIRKH